MSAEIDPALLEILACPKCRQSVELDAEQAALLCPHCRLRYRIDDGIPVMLIDEAESY
ncbi:MAG: Trm112 family protein [Candidatus Dormiibacterota bacterium]